MALLLHMAGTQAAAVMTSDYDSKSTFQMTANQRHISLISEALTYVHRPGEVLTVADYGSATGLNSMMALTPAFQTFRSTSSTPILVYHTDLPDNHWSVLFNNALSSPLSYLSLPDIYVAGVGRSYYEQVFPANSIWLMHAANTLHWLSTHPKGQGQLQKSAEDDPELLAELRALSEADINRFISLRKEELKVGGRLILHAFTSFFPTHYRLHVLQRMQQEGLISSEPLQSSTIYFFPTSVAGVTEAVAKHPSLRLSSIQEYEYENPFYAAYAADGDTDKYVTGMIGLLRSTQEGLVRDVLKEEASDQDLVEVFFKYTAELVSEHIVPVTIKEVDAVIDKLV